MLSDNIPGRLGGFNIMVANPAMEMPRSIWERLFSWPWRPCQLTKWIENPSCPKYGEVWRAGSTLVCDPRTADDLRRGMTTAGREALDD